MATILVINHHSLQDDGYIADCFEEACERLNTFFKTWQATIDKKVCENFIICDVNIWNWQLDSTKNMYDYTSSLNHDAQLLVLNFLNIATKTSLDVFDDEILEVITSPNISATINQNEAQLLGCVCLSDNSFLLSLQTSDIWRNNIVCIEWSTGAASTLKNECHNFSSELHVENYYQHHISLQPVTIDHFKSSTPSVVITQNFWNWFIDLDILAQHQLISKSVFCSRNHWIARNDSTYKQLTKTKNSLFEIRFSPNGRALRVYTQRISDQEIVFLGGSDKDDQDKTIKYIDKYIDSINNTIL